MDVVNICMRMYDDITYKRQNYRVHNDAIGEKSIVEFSGRE